MLSNEQIVTAQSLPLCTEGKVGCEATRMRCSDVDFHLTTVFDGAFFSENGNPFVLRTFPLTGELPQGSNGATVAEYTYDAWGQLLTDQDTLANTIGGKNPLRYRGYYYDSETGFYYLQSRYYDPVVQRFINADGYVYNNILGFNLFLYCNNNPINYYDPYGKSASSVLGYWASLGWTLCIGDGPLPFGEILYVGGLAVLGIATYFITETVDSSISNGKDDIYITDDDDASATNYPGDTTDNNDVGLNKPNIPYPGDDPTQKPGDDYEWKGKPGEAEGGDNGAWINQKTGEQLHPDLKHKKPVGPHWDYTDGKKPVKWWRIFPDGRIEPKP